MINYQRLVNQLRTLRADLDEQTITHEIQKIALTSMISISTIAALKVCIEWAEEGLPMPWEDLQMDFKKFFGADELSELVFQVSTALNIHPFNVVNQISELLYPDDGNDHDKFKDFH